MGNVIYLYRETSLLGYYFSGLALRGQNQDVNCYLPLMDDEVMSSATYKD